MDRLSPTPAELEVGSVRPAVRRLRILSIPWGLTVWGVLGGGGVAPGDTEGGGSDSGPGRSWSPDSAWLRPSCLSYCAGLIGDLE